MKRLHLMIVRAYVGPLLVTFVIFLFILVMQFLWK
jgi:lipopolysaccharide export system permease protein